MPPPRSRIVGAILIAASVLCLAVPATWLPGMRMSVVSIIEPALTLLAGGPGAGTVPDDPEDLLRELRHLRDENAALRQKLVESEDQCLQLAEQLTTIGEFRQIAPKVIEPQTDRVIPARVIGRSTNWQSLTVTINRGAVHGVGIGCGVTSGRAVVGVVSEVGPRTARVALLPERGVKIPARMLRTRRQGLVVGDGTRVMMKYVHALRTVGGKEVEARDKIITTGLAGMFRAGWVIGEVANVGNDPGEPFLNIEVAPQENFSDLESVLVIDVPHEGLAEE